MTKEPVLSTITYTEHNAKYRMKIVGGLHYIQSNGTPYFSLTAEIDRWAGNRWVDDSGGACHDAILKHRPDFADLADLHLSDVDGYPMHALENAWYWAGGTEWNGEKRDNPPNARSLAEHLRIDYSDAQAIIDNIGQRTKQEFAAYLDTQTERWRREAVECIAKYQLRICGDPWDDKREPRKTFAEIAAADAINAKTAAQMAAERLAKKRQDIEDRTAATIRNAELQRVGGLWIIDHGLDFDNSIFYNHTGRWCFGWRTPMNDAEVNKVLSVISEFPFPYDIKTAKDGQHNGRTLSGERT